MGYKSAMWASPTRHKALPPRTRTCASGHRSWVAFFFQPKPGGPACLLSSHFPTRRAGPVSPALGSRGLWPWSPIPALPCLEPSSLTPTPPFMPVSIPSPGGLSRLLGTVGTAP